MLSLYVHIYLNNTQFHSQLFFLTESHSTPQIHPGGQQSQSGKAD